MTRAKAERRRCESEQRGREKRNLRWALAVIVFIIVLMFIGLGMLESKLRHKEGHAKEGGAANVTGWYIGRTRRGMSTSHEHEHEHGEGDHGHSHGPGHSHAPKDFNRAFAIGVFLNSADCLWIAGAFTGIGGGCGAYGKGFSKGGCRAEKSCQGPSRTGQQNEDFYPRAEVRPPNAN